MPIQVPAAWRLRLERTLAWLGDRLNPILVKETRQALKSWQFLGAFALLLAAAWGWSLLGLAMMGPATTYSAARTQELFAGYYVMLAICTLVFVPFGAYRSLAGEQEDRTYELLSITTLSPWQIVSGKLGSAVLQMLIYLSVLSPCLAFTYLLRGVSLVAILFFLFYTALFSLGLSLVALLLGTLTSEKHWQVILSVLVIVGLALCCLGACTFTLEVMDEALPFDDPDFVVGNLAFLTGYASYFVLLFLATASQLTFAADNRSTRLRVMMLAQYLLFIAWIGWAWFRWPPDPELLVAALVVPGLHWYLMGTLMLGESPDLSLRVRRRLPQSFLGRAFLTWFNPGPATGYVFALTGMAGGLLVVAAAVLLDPRTLARRWISIEEILAFGLLALCYMAIFLGLGLLVLRLLRRFLSVGPVWSVLVQAVLVLVACGVPFTIQLSIPGGHRLPYNVGQVTNVLWTLAAVLDRKTAGALPLLVLILPVAAAIVFALNLPGIVREVRFVRIAKPRRVVEEDAAALPPVPHEPVQISPWDVVSRES